MHINALIRCIYLPDGFHKYFAPNYYIQRSRKEEWDLTTLLELEESLEHTYIRISNIRS